MPIYLWSGTDRAGKKQKGEIEADNPDKCLQWLKLFF